MEAEEAVLPKIGTEVVDGRLVIGPEPNTGIQTDRPINYELNVESLRELKVTGSGDVDAVDVTTDSLTTTVDGTGTVRISGEADSQEVSISGSGEYRAEDFETRVAKVDVGGTGSAVVNASETLEATVSGAGSVEYVGDPTVDTNTSGAGTVNER